MHIVEPPKKSAGPGRYILIGLGVVAAVGVAYAAWQTLRADDDLWIEDLGDPGSSVRGRRLDAQTSTTDDAS